MPRTSKTPNSAPAAVAPDAPAPAQSSLPLFYREPEVLSAIRHGDLVLVPQSDVSFARPTNAIPATAGEILDLGLHFPLVFTAGPGTPALLAVVGLGDGRNLFVDAQGEWDPAKPIPAYVRRYPFILSEEPDQRFTLCVDRTAPHLAAKADKPDGQPLFAGLEPSEITRQILAFCDTYQGQIRLTSQFCTELDQAGLLIDAPVGIVSPKGNRHEMSGFRLISEEKFNDLPDRLILAWKKNGILAGIYAVMQSQRNWISLAQRFDQLA